MFFSVTEGASIRKILVQSRVQLMYVKQNIFIHYDSVSHLLIRRRYTAHDNKTLQINKQAKN